MFQLLKKTKKVLNEVINPNYASDLVKQIHDEFYNANSKYTPEPVSRGERMKKLGFINTPEAQDFFMAEDKKELYKTAQNYLVFYPNNKFISWVQARNICEKYGLECVRCEDYTGTIPEKNLREIESFRLRNEDAIVGLANPLTEEQLMNFSPEYRNERMTHRYGFWICAPKRDVVERKVDDPIVLQRVKDGFLIVTAWGDEASDKNIVNEKMN